MTGYEIIQWAITKCDERNIPPSDSALIRMIRKYPNEPEGDLIRAAKEGRGVLLSTKMRDWDRLNHPSDAESYVDEAIALEVEIADLRARLAEAEKRAAAAEHQACVDTVGRRNTMVYCDELVKRMKEQGELFGQQIATLTQERDAAIAALRENEEQESENWRRKAGQLEQERDKISKERDTLAIRFQDASQRLSIAEQEREAARFQVDTLKAKLTEERENAVKVNAEIVRERDAAATLAEVREIESDRQKARADALTIARQEWQGAMSLATKDRDHWKARAEKSEANFADLHARFLRTEDRLDAAVEAKEKAEESLRTMHEDCAKIAEGLHDPGDPDYADGDLLALVAAAIRAAREGK